MYSIAVTITAILHIQQFLLINAFPNGAPSAVCADFKPGHLPSQKPLAPSPYNVTVDNIINGEYIPGHNYAGKLYTGF